MLITILQVRAFLRPVGWAAGQLSCQDVIGAEDVSSNLRSVKSDPVSARCDVSSELLTVAVAHSRTDEPRHLLLSSA